MKNLVEECCSPPLKACIIKQLGKDLSILYKSYNSNVEFSLPSEKGTIRDTFLPCSSILRLRVTANAVFPDLGLSEVIYIDGIFGP